MGFMPVMAIPGDGGHFSVCWDSLGAPFAKRRTLRGWQISTPYPHMGKHMTATSKRSLLLSLSYATGCFISYPTSHASVNSSVNLAPLSLSLSLSLSHSRSFSLALSPLQQSLVCLYERLLQGIFRRRQVLVQQHGSVLQEFHAIRVQLVPKVKGE